MEWSCLIIYRKLVCSIWWLWSFVQSISGERQLVKLFRSEWKKLAFSTLVPVRVLSRPILWEISMTEVMLVTYFGEQSMWVKSFRCVGENTNIQLYTYSPTYIFHQGHNRHRKSSPATILPNFSKVSDYIDITDYEFYGHGPEVLGSYFL